MWAMGRNKKDLISMLIGANADVNAQANNRYVPAMRCGYQAAAVLVARGRTDKGMRCTVMQGDSVVGGICERIARKRENTVGELEVQAGR